MPGGAQVLRGVAVDSALPQQKPVEAAQGGQMPGDRSAAQPGVGINVEIKAQISGPGQFRSVAENALNFDKSTHTHSSELADRPFSMRQKLRNAVIWLCADRPNLPYALQTSCQ